MEAGVDAPRFASAVHVWLDRTSHVVVSTRRAWPERIARPPRPPPKAATAAQNEEAAPRRSSSMRLRDATPFLFLAALRVSLRASGPRQTHPTAG